MFRVLCDAVRRMGRDERGNVFVLFGAAAIPLLLIMGGAVDVTRYARYKAELANAVDSAALALAKDHYSFTAAQAKTFVTDYVAAHNIADSSFTVANITVVKLDNGFRVTAEASMKTIFLPLTGYTKGGQAISGMGMDIVAEVAAASKRLEVAIALDNSGSMAGTKLSTLKDAAEDLVGTLFDLAEGSTLTNPVKVGIVPFAGAVNVGTQYATASWMDTGAKGTYHGDAMEANGASNVNNFSLFNYLKDSSNNNITWGGCVEARPIPYDISDDAPSTAASPTAEQKKTLFVPMFAPDEPDNWTCSTSDCSYSGSTNSTRRYNGAPSGNQSYNNYLPDAGSGSTSGSVCGTATSSNANWTCQNGNDNCGGTNTGRSEEKAFAGTSISASALCKYGKSTAKATVSNVTVGGIPGGPNFMCTTQALLPLTTNESTVLAKIDAMEAEGATSVMEGAAWGWRILSPGVPFTEGAAYDDDETTKVLVLMTDGRNTYYPNSSFLKSWYEVYGYVTMNHLGSTSTDSATLSEKMDDRTKAACDAIKAKNIAIYTVGFDISGSGAAAALGVLEYCASQPDYFYAADDNDELLAAFEQIGDSISNLHLVK